MRSVNACQYSHVATVGRTAVTRNDRVPSHDIRIIVVSEQSAAAVIGQVIREGATDAERRGGKRSGPVTRDGTAVAGFIARESAVGEHGVGAGTNIFFSFQCRRTGDFRRNGK